MKENKEFKELFNEDMIYFDVEADNWKELLEKASDILYEKGYVKRSYKKALLNREKEYPTGLPTEGIQVALPHTYCEHCLKPTIMVMNLRNIVYFKEMGNGINDVPVQLVFVIVLTDSSHEVGTLQKFMEMFTRKGVLIELKNTKTSKEAIDILNREFYKED